MHLTEIYLRNLIEEIIAEANESEAQPSEEPAAEEEAPQEAGGLSANIEQMSPEAARALADEAFDNITAGQIGKAKSSINSLQRTAAGRIALAVQALLRFGNASPAEVNSYADVIRKIAASADAPPK